MPETKSEAKITPKTEAKAETKTELTCIVCPRGCTLQLEGQPGSFRVSGNACKRGEAFAISEQTAPMRTLCTTVRTAFAEVPVLPVRLSGEIPKEKIFDAMAAINAITLTRHLPIGGVIAHDLAGLGVDLIAASGLLRPADG